MRFTFRLKVVLLLVTALLSIGLMIIGSEVIAAKFREELNDVEARLVPRAELALKLEASFVELKRSLQDAVSAQDLEGLAAAKVAHRRVLEMVENAGPALAPSDAAALRLSMEDYFSAANRVSVMLINGDTGESTVSAITEMQDKQKEAERVIRESTAIGRGEIAHAFTRLRQVNLRSRHFRMTTGAVALLLMLSLWLWASRQTLKSLASLSEGFRSFATGKFEQPIEIKSEDELGDLTRDANAMARNLKHLADERDHADWLKSGLVEVSIALRGNQSLRETAERAMPCLAQRVGALAAALFLKDETGVLERVGGYADFRESEKATMSGPCKDGFGPGEGLVGQAGVEGQLRVIHEPPVGYFDIVSGLGEGAPRTLVLFPLKSAGETVAVVEFALFGDLSDRSREYLESVEDTLVVALQAAHARENVNRLHVETKNQAELLAQQEEELRQSNQELSAQQEELRLANVELEQKQEVLTKRNQALDRARAREQDKAEELSRVSLYKSQFLANMSHELRTPLNSMLLLSYLLAENSSNNLTPKQIEHCSTIHSAGQELLSLINQVLDLAKIEAGKQEVEITIVPLGPLMDKVRRMFEPLAGKANLSFKVELRPESPKEIQTDSSRLERILINLLGNAIKFTERGHVSLLVGPPSPGTTFERSDLVVDDAIAFAVADSGIGIAPTELARVFSPFEQVEATSSRSYEGSGLGLAIARESALLLGGELCAESELGSGSTFTCYLPRGLQITQTGGVPQVLATTAHATLPESGSSLILVIEDDPVVAEQLVEIIRDRGLEAVVADNGEDGLRLAEEQPPLGIVLDVKLPDVDGWTVMERLKNSPVTQGIPVHFLSALDAPENGFNRGAIGYLNKPATRVKLKELIDTLVPGRGGRGSKILVVEDSVVEGQSIVAILEHENFEAKHVTSAEAALTALEEETYGCIVLDLGLKEMDGLGLLEVMRNRPDLVGTGVVIHTGRSLTRKETNRLQAYSQAIVMKDGSSSARLLEEIRLFIHHVRATSPLVESQEVATHTTFYGTRLLIVEDDIRTVYSLSALLQSRGCEVLVAENGLEALSLLEKDPSITCVLMDIMMPEMDGYETMRRLRADSLLRDVPIIVLTAKAMAGERERCMEAGANDYLSKPVDCDQLFAALKRWTTPLEGSDAT